MKEKKGAGAKLATAIVFALISGGFLSSLSDSWKIGLYHEVISGTLWRRMSFMWRADKETFFMLLLCCIAALVFLISILRCLFLLFALVTGGTKSSAAESTYRPAKRRPAAARAAGSRKSKNAPVRTATHINGVNRGDLSSQAISCDHRNGKDKYLEQIKGFLDSGLIEKKEYDLLYARYKKLHISDDYH